MAHWILSMVGHSMWYHHPHVLMDCFSNYKPSSTLSFSRYLNIITEDSNLLEFWRKTRSRSLICFLTIAILLLGTFILLLGKLTTKLSEFLGDTVPQYYVIVLQNKRVLSRIFLSRVCKNAATDGIKLRF